MVEVKRGTIANMPVAVPSRRSPVRYPWREMQPGDWFMFESGNLGSCRVSASMRGREFDMTYEVFVGLKDRKIYCRRIDGMAVVPPKLKLNENFEYELPKAPIRKGEPPAAAQLVEWPTEEDEEDGGVAEEDETAHI